MLKPQDILIALKLITAGDKKPSRFLLARELCMSSSEIHEGIGRAQKSRLLTEDERPRLSALLEFLVHGLPYCLPAEHGSIAKGIPTSFAGPPLNAQIVFDQDALIPVWPHSDGTARGYELKPIYRSAPDAALKDPKLYELLALVDAVRNGRARERKLAISHLQTKLAQR
jgi:hypothetical protein